MTVAPNFGGTLHFDALIQPDLVGPSVGLNSTTNLSLGLGQVERFTFNASAGDTVALQVSGVTTTPTGQPIQFLVYRPDAGAITTSTATYSNISPTSGQLVNLPNLPVSGTYTVIAAPAFGLPGSAQFSLVSGVTGGLPADGTVQTYDARASGQNVYLNFTAKAGDNLELELSHMSVAGATNNSFQVYVYNQAGTQVAFNGCYPTNPGASCNLHLWNLAAGKYSVTVAPNFGGTLHFDALIQPDLVGPSVGLNSTTNLSLGLGQVERFTFNASAGDTVALQVSGVTTTPTGQPIQFLVYRPDAGAITTSTATYSNISPTSGQLVNLPNLPVSGTYTVIAAPAFGLPGSAQFSLVSGVTGGLPADGTVQTYDARASGQNVYLNFTAKAGDNLELELSHMSVAGATNNSFQVYVYNQAGTQVAFNGCYPTNPGASCNLHLWNLAAGKYSVTVAPNFGGTLHFDALIQPDLIGPSVGLNSTTNLSLGLGQVERFTFNASAGDTVALQVSGVTTTPTGQPIQFLVYRPDAGAITTSTATYSNISPTSGQLVNLPNLPVSGTYTVIAAPAFGLPGSAVFTLSSQTGNTPQAKGSLPSSASNTLHTKVIRRSIHLSFETNAADNLEISLGKASVFVEINSGFGVDVDTQGNQGVASNSCRVLNLDRRYPEYQWNVSTGPYSLAVMQCSDNGIDSSTQERKYVMVLQLMLDKLADMSQTAKQAKRSVFLEDECGEFGSQLCLGGLTVLNVASSTVDRTHIVTTQTGHRTPADIQIRPS